MANISYVYIEEGQVSREYLHAGACVTDGAKTVKREANWIGYRVNVNEGVGLIRDYGPAVEKAKAVLEGKPIGTTIRLQAVVRKTKRVVDQVRFKKIQDDPIPNTEGVEGIDRFVGWIESHKTPEDKVRYAGICVCKHPSDHADCAAVDVFATEQFMRRMKAESLRDPAYYHTKYVILYKEICYPAPGQCLPYHGDTHYHIHLSVNGGIKDAACR